MIHQVSYMQLATIKSPKKTRQAKKETTYSSSSKRALSALRKRSTSFVSVTWEGSCNGSWAGRGTASDWRTSNVLHCARFLSSLIVMTAAWKRSSSNPSWTPAIASWKKSQTSPRQEPSETCSATLASRLRVKPQSSAWLVQISRITATLGVTRYTSLRSVWCSVLWKGKMSSTCIALYVCKRRSSELLSRKLKSSGVPVVMLQRSCPSTKPAAFRSSGITPKSRASTLRFVESCVRSCRKALSS
ncbi:uncharacterized protein J3D65DRAFT_637998 [Phyllosticta citribraziliensis]|uniref:Uncharacterized protein n=1 Tax=Phyllosticta citribraziliensis TaxID=989973 RepID=A0ABR1L8J5_9PEZI